MKDFVKCLCGVAAVLIFSLASVAHSQIIPNSGQKITPKAPSGTEFQPLNPGLADQPDYLAGQAVTSIVSPDGRTMLVLTSGYNLVNSASGEPLPADSTQFVFIYDIAHGHPAKKQVLHVPNTYSGIVFDPSGSAFYVSGGVDDNVHAYALGSNGTWREQAGSPIDLGHKGKGVGNDVKPQAAGITISKDGTKLLVVNNYNDSITVLTKSGTAWAVSAELDLRPGKLDPRQSAVPGGAYPLWAAITSKQIAYVSSIRDREIEVIDISAKPKLIKRIKVPGQPNRMVLNKAETRLYVAQDNTDSVAVIQTVAHRLIENIPAGAPGGLLPAGKAKFKGNNTNSVTLSEDEKRLYVTNGWMNDVAVIQLSPTPGRSKVVGLIPTGWYPNSVSLSSDGKFIYVLNGKSPTGPNPQNCMGLTPQRKNECQGGNDYNLQKIKAGLQSFPMPNADALQALTQQVAANNNFQARVTASDARKLAFLRAHIRHVIYIIKENRTYDQVLGDLEVGNGDPRLTEFPAKITPNFHQLAREFVTLDNFYCTSEVSYDGWSWSTSARAPDVLEKNVSVNYAGRGGSYDSEGPNRDINVGLKTQAERQAANPLTPEDPDDLPGTEDVDAPDSPEGENGTGYLWNGALRAGLTVRNYGFFVDLARYSLPPEQQKYQVPLLLDPAATKTQVAFPANPSLMNRTDIYFRGFDNAFPDYYRFKEWEREFDGRFSKGGLPNLSLMRLMHDHTGDFAQAILGVNTPETQVADNDYAVGLIIDKIAHSRYRDSTLVFVIEDDSQDGGDHVDSHRSVAFVVGPYVKHKAVVSTSYTTLSMLRTMEEVLGIRRLNLNDSSANPMTDAFDISQKTWSYTAEPSAMLAATQLPIPRKQGDALYPSHDAAYWANATRGMDFSVEDRLDPVVFNRVLWRGIMGEKEYPAVSSGENLRENREELLQRSNATQ